MATSRPLATPLVYDPRFHTFDSWASLMCEQYSNLNLEIPGPHTDWQGWAVGLKAIDQFANAGTPDPYQFQDWQEWASVLVNIMSETPG